MWHGQHPGAMAAASAGARTGVTTSWVGEIRAGRGIAARIDRPPSGCRNGAPTRRAGRPAGGTPEEGVSVAMTADVPKGPVGPDQREAVRAWSTDVLGAATTAAADRVDWCNG